MKNLQVSLLPVLLLLVSVSIFSCKGKNGSASVDTTAVNATQPVDTSMIQDDTAHIAEEDSLTTPKK